jgi:hypothetical protein
LHKISRDAAKYKVKLVLVEPNFGDGMFTSILTPILLQHHKCSVEEGEWTNQSKENRIIDTLEPILNQHKLIVDKKVLIDEARENSREARYCLFHQMTRITREKNSILTDDKVDALSGAVNYWVASMARDSKKASDKKLLNMRMRKIDEFIMKAKRIHGNHSYFRRGKGRAKVIRR